MSDAWYYLVDDSRAGPVSLEQLCEFLQSPHGGPDTLVWRRGMSDWRPAGEIAELSAAFDGLPPPPRRAPTPPASMKREDAPAFTDPEIEPTEKQSLGRRLLGIGAAIASALAGVFAVKVFGLTLVWPAAFIAITWLILSKCKVEPFAIPMLSFVVGHTAWVIGAHILVYAMGRLTTQHLPVLFDVAAMIVLVTWFLITRSRAAAIGILVYQSIELFAGIMFAAQLATPAAGGSTALLLQGLHALLRVAGIACSIYAITLLGKKQSPASALRR